MNQDELIKEVIKANATEFYNDAAKPSIRIAGKSLAQFTALLTRPLGRIAEITEKNINLYIDKIDKIDPSNLVPPETRTLVPILEKLRYIDDSVVADYYAEILATASTKENSKKSYTAFIEILNRLSADELKILEYINSKYNIIKIKPITSDESEKYNLDIGANTLTITGSIPIIDLNLQKTGEEGYKTIKRNVCLIAENIKLTEPENCDIYLDNMISLGILEKQSTKTFAIKKIYDPIKEHKDINKFKRNTPEGSKVIFAEGRIDTTYLGKKLLDIGSIKIKNEK